MVSMRGRPTGSSQADQARSVFAADLIAFVWLTIWATSACLPAMCDTDQVTGRAAFTSSQPGIDTRHRPIIPLPVRLRAAGWCSSTMIGILQQSGNPKISQSAALSHFTQSTFAVASRSSEDLFAPSKSLSFPCRSVPANRASGLEPTDMRPPRARATLPTVAGLLGLSFGPTADEEPSPAHVARGPDLLLTLAHQRRRLPGPALEPAFCAATAAEYCVLQSKRASLTRSSIILPAACAAKRRALATCLSQRDARLRCAALACICR